MQRYGLKCWRRLNRCNIRNYTIYHQGGVLFAYFEYHGVDLKADMALMEADPATQRWWAIMMPLQERLPGTPEGEWWMPMEEMFHFDGDGPSTPAVITSTLAANRRNSAVFPVE